MRLNGANCAAQSAIWTNVITEASTGKHIKVVMDKDWIAPNSGDNLFGSATGFSSGRIYVPANTTITFDLNGHIVNRQKTTYKDGGPVFYIDGTFNLIDSKFDENKIKLYNAYLDNANTDLTALGKSLGFGRITGGWGGSGAFLGSNTTILNIYGGMICNNNAQNLGVFSVPGVINIYDGLISDNHCYTNGGVISYNGTLSVNIHGGIFYNNSATTNGSVVYMNNANATLNISGGIIAHNNAGNYSTIEFHGKTLNLSGGEIAYNHSDGSIGAFGVWSGTMNMTGGKIINNVTVGNGAGIYLREAKAIISGGLIVGNQAGSTLASGGGGISNDQNAVLVIKAGAQIYGNIATGAQGGNTANPRVSNVWLDYKENKLVIDESLLTENKSTYVGVHLGQKFIDTGDNVFTSGFSAHNSGGLETLRKAFFADNTGDSIQFNGTEGVIRSGQQSTKTLTWKWEGALSGSTELTHLTLPYYNGKTYKISASEDNNQLIVKNKNGESKRFFEISEPGSYAYYVDGDYTNPTFMVTIEEKILIDSPINTIKTFLYDGTNHTFIPENFDPNTMEITGNIASSEGVYTAKISLKNKVDCVWRETGNYKDLEYKYVILPAGIKATEMSGYEYLFKDSTENGNYRAMYIEKEYWHKLNDSEVNQKDGTAKYVLGNIPQKTSLESFVNNLENSKELLKIYNEQGEKVFDGTLNDSNKNILVATGFKVELYKVLTDTTPIDVVYLSVLGDVIADGAINAMDVTFVNRIARGEIKLEDLSIEQQLAAMVDNKGKVTSIDGKILLNVIGGNTETNGYFVNVAQKEKYQLWDLNIDTVNNKVYRTNADITTENLLDNAIIGNISPKTKVIDFKAQLASQLGIESTEIAIYKANGATATENNYIGTGSYIEYNGKRIYLSVLGDLTGDGRVDTTDMTYLNRIVNGNVNLNTNVMEQKLIMLAATIQNKGNITTADSESIWNYIGGNIEMSKYF